MPLSPMPPNGKYGPVMCMMVPFTVTPPDVVSALRTMGHAVNTPEDATDGRRSSDTWGNLQTVSWDKSANRLSAGSDPRNPVGLGQVVDAQSKVKP